ncbi:MAG: regulatory protein RecX [bacterium]|nr:regulatory protein RecX [bacterium]
MADLNKKAMNYCLYLLSRQSYSQKQLRDKLAQKKYPADTIIETLAKLSQWHYLDDEAFAAAFAGQRLRFKPRGARLIEQELRQKGVGRDLARQVTAGIMEKLGLDEEKLARAALVKKISSYRKNTPEKGMAKAKNFLIRQGFSYEIVSKIIRDAWGQKDL